VWLLAFALADDVPGAHAREGESVGGATVTRVDVHPEYHRIWLQGAGGGTAPVELTTGQGGLCDVAGVTVYPRPELGDGGAVDLTAAGLELCRRLAERPLTLRERGGFVPTASPELGVPPTVPREVPEVRPNPLHVVVLAFLGLGLALVVRARRAVDGAMLAVTALALGVRLLLPGGTWNGAGAAWEKFVLAWGADEGSPYGEGWPALMGPALAWWGRDPETLWALNRLWSAAAAPLVLAVGRTWLDRRAALAAALLAACWPVHLRLAATEEMSVVLTTLELAAVAAVARRPDGLAGAFAVVATTLAVHTRPEALPFALLVAVWGGRWVALGVLGGAVWRLAQLHGEQGVLRAGAFAEPSFWLGLLPHVDPAANVAAASLYGHGHLAPAALWPLALVGLLAAPPRVRGALLLWWALVELPVAQKASPLADLVRLQLPAQAPWLLLVGMGAARLGGSRVWLGAPAAVAALWWALQPGWLRWATHAEAALLLQVVPKLPEGTVVLSADIGSREGKLRRAMEVLGPARWIPATALGPELHPDVWWRGVSGGPPPDCELTERVVVPIPVTADEDLSIAPGQVMGFWTVGPCAWSR